MDAELKTLLEQLISAINTPSESDINALAMSLTGIIMSCLVSVFLGYITYKLGKRQNEIAEQQTDIQKQQYKIDKFKLYKDLHRDLYKSKCMLESILPKIYEYFVAADKQMQDNSIEEYLSKINDMISQIQNGVSDVKLRADKQLNVQDVLNLLIFASVLLIKAQDSPNGISICDWIETTMRGAELRENRTIDEQIQIIDKVAKDPNLKSGMELFVKQYKEVFEGENNILAQLQCLYNE